MTSVVSLRTLANYSSDPIAVPVDMQHECSAELHLPADSGIDREPYRSEMEFERRAASCYSFQPLAVLVNQSRGGIVPVGFAGEQPCGSTLIDAAHRNHQISYLCDASASHVLDDMPADDADRAISRISGFYGDAYETTGWIASPLSRKLGHGKNAGG